MRFCKAGSTRFSTGAAIWLCCLLAPTQLRAAATRVQARAEVVAPATVDSAGMLAAAAAQPSGPPPAGEGNQQVRPEIRLVSVAGVTRLTVDYN